MSYYPILPIPSWEDPQLSSTPGVVALRPITEPFYLVPHSTLCGLLRDRVPTALPPHAASSQSQSLPESAALVHYSDDAFATANASSSEFSSQPVSEALMPIYSAVHSATVGAYGGPQPSSAISVPSYPYALPDTMAPYTSPLFPVGPPSMHLAEPSPFSPLTLPMPSTHTTDASLSSSRFSDAPGAALAPDTPERPRRLEAPAGHLPSIRAPAVGRDVSVPCSIFNSQPLGALSATSSQPGIKARHGHTTGARAYEKISWGSTGVKVTPSCKYESQHIRRRYIQTFTDHEEATVDPPRRRSDEPAPRRNGAIPHPDFDMSQH